MLGGLLEAWRSGLGVWNVVGGGLVRVCLGLGAGQVRVTVLVSWGLDLGALCGGGDEDISIQEGASTNRPPFFNGDNYSFWKIKMQAWVEGIDVAVWDAIEEGPYIPMHTVDGKVVENARKEWSLEEKSLAQFGLRAKTIIISALGNDEFPRILNCKTAKEMWDVLKVTHEGTDEVKRSKINALTREFEMFQMNPSENI